MHPFFNSFIRSIVHSYIHSFIRSFMHPFTSLCVHLSVLLLHNNKHCLFFSLSIMDEHLHLYCFHVYRVFCLFDPHVHKRVFENVAVRHSQRNKTNKIYAHRTNLQLMSWRCAEDKQTRASFQHQCLCFFFFFNALRPSSRVTRRWTRCELTMLAVNNQS